MKIITIIYCLCSIFFLSCNKKVTTLNKNVAQGLVNQNWEHEITVVDAKKINH